eukprot:1168841-Prymnesium_polylepis.2
MDSGGPPTDTPRTRAPARWSRFSRMTASVYSRRRTTSRLWTRRASAGTNPRLSPWHTTAASASLT